MANKNPKPEKDNRKRRFKDEQTDKRIHEHLVNEGDSISEKDIENVRTDEGITVANEKEEPIPLPEPADVDKGESIEVEKEKVIKSNSDPGIETPWNILDA